MPRREEIQMARALARSLADPDLSAALASKQGGGAQAKPLCTSNKRAPVLSVPIAKPAEAAAAPVSPLTPLCRHTGEPPRAPGRRAIEQPVPVRPLRSDRRPGGGGVILAPPVSHSVRSHSTCESCATLPPSDVPARLRLLFDRGHKRRNGCSTREQSHGHDRPPLGVTRRGAGPISRPLSHRCDAVRLAVARALTALR